MLAIAEKPTPSWKRSLVTLDQVERDGESSDGVNAASGVASDGSRYLNSTAELWHWIQEALGDAQTQPRLLDDEDVLELLRNGPGVRDTFHVTPEPLLSWDAATAISLDTVSEEVESGSEIAEYENDNEAGTYEATGLCNQYLTFIFGHQLCPSVYFVSRLQSGSIIEIVLSCLRVYTVNSTFISRFVAG